MAHTPLEMTIDEAHAEVKRGWAKSCNPEGIRKAVAFIPQNGPLRVGQTIAENCCTIFNFIKEVFAARRASVQDAQEVGEFRACRKRACRSRA